jgi:putative oxidoreductase
MRVVAAAALAVNAINGLSHLLQVGSATIAVLQMVAGLLLLGGLWTPFAGLLVVVLEARPLFAQPHDPWPHILLATLCGALALLGPGSWSADAWLYGWKRIDIRTRRPHVDTSAESEP